MSWASSVQCAASVQWCYLQAGTVLIVPLLTSYLSFLALLHFLPSVYTSIYQARYIIIITCSAIKTNSPFQCQPRVWRGRPGAPALAPTTSRPGPPSWTLTTGGRPSLLHHWRTYPETWSMSHQWGQFLKVFLMISVWQVNGHNCLDYKHTRWWFIFPLPPANCQLDWRVSLNQLLLGVMCELQCEEPSYLFLACSELRLSCIKNEFKPTRKHCE